ncbi:MAG TPA: hypothetical protein VJ767_09125 [Nitrososphaeraceae archaeon]|nr:hypothetical protein [Nitrososphaeraceae archaeon]
MIQKIGGDKIDITLIMPFPVKRYYRGPPATEIYFRRERCYHIHG